MSIQFDLITVVNELPDRAWSAVAAIMLCSFLGSFWGAYKGLSVPFLWISLQKFLGVMAVKSYKPIQASSALFFRGGLITFFALFIAVVFCSFFVVGAKFYPSYGFVEIIALSCCLSTGSLWKTLGMLKRSLEGKGDKSDQAQGYASAARTSRADLNATDKHGSARIITTSAIISLDRALVFPCLWYLLFGLFGAFAVSALAGVFWLIGREGYTKSYSSLAGGVLKLLILPSAFITNIITFISIMLIPQAGIWRGLKGLFSFKGGRPSILEGGTLLSISAYALGFVLGGPVKDVNGFSFKRMWVGRAGVSAKGDANELKRVQYFMFVFTLVFMCSLMVMVMALRELFSLS